MSIETRPTVSIVDYGLGNLFSVKHACDYAGMEATITSAAEIILSTDAVILPGVGAFRDAMDCLVRQDLVPVLKDVVRSEKPLLGICLGMQLLMTESQEFGITKGLGLLEGEVLRLETSFENGQHLKVPHVGWSPILISSNNANDQSNNPMFAGVSDGTDMYFVHSYFTKPMNRNVISSTTKYGAIEFCSSFVKDNIFGYQFHPERSGASGLRIYENLRSKLAPLKKD